MTCSRWVPMLLVPAALLAPASPALAQAETGSGPRPADFILPAVILVAVVVWRLVMASGSGRTGGSRPGQSRTGAGNYGPAGGAVCRHCGRAFSRSFWGPNLGIGKLSRCPHCGKWSVAPAASAAALARAEALAGAAAGSGEGDEASPPAADDGLRRRIEDSRYETPDR